ncbi:MAG: metallophosphoesterase [bacterium]
MNRSPETLSLERTADGDFFIGRRAFLCRGGLFMAASTVGLPCFAGADEGQASVGKPLVRIGLMTDVHYADRDTAGTRCYRESVLKVREAVNQFNAAEAHVAVELGDFIDAADTVEGELGHLKTIEAEYVKFAGDRHHVLGNHCVWTLTKKQFLETCGQKISYYSFDKGGTHFVILDACYRKDGVAYGAKNFEWTDTEIPAEEQAWLKADLDSTSNSAVAFVHQRLDVAEHYGVHSGPAVRNILEDSGKLLAVFQGHYHLNEYEEINKIHYCTLRSVVDGSGEKNSAYAIVDIYGDGSLRVDGFRRQTGYSLKVLS